MSQVSIQIPVDLTNPGQFFACCGLLELADRLWPGAEGWFESSQFLIRGAGSISKVLAALRESSVANTMTPAQLARLEELTAMKKKERESIPGAEDEKKALESLRRELPIVLGEPISLRIDWFRDGDAGGSRFKTWAGLQTVIDLTQSMHAGLPAAEDDADLWQSARNVGLPYYFDSDQGGQGSALDIGFSFDPLSASDATRIEGTCKPTLELLAFIGFQRFRPREIVGKNRFVYVAWGTPLSPLLAACAACEAIAVPHVAIYEFRLLYRTKYLKSFLPAIPFQGERDE